MVEEFTSPELAAEKYTVPSESLEQEMLEDCDRAIQRMITETQLEFEETVLAWEKQLIPVAKNLVRQGQCSCMHQAVIEAREMLDQTIVTQHKKLDAVISAMQGLGIYRKQGIMQHFEER